MEFTTFVRRPFMVDAVEVTLTNIQEVADLIGELKIQGSTPYIAVNRRIVPVVPKVFIGWYMTRFGDEYRCYPKSKFLNQFTEHRDVITFSFPEEEYEEDDETSEVVDEPVA